MARADDEVMAFLRSKSGVIRRAEALALGMASTTLHEWVRKGLVEAAGRGIYVLPGVLDHERTLLCAATRALDAVVSHESAARLHGINLVDPSRVTITVPVRRSNRFKGVVVHQSTDLTIDETTTSADLPVTDPARTILDLAAVLPPKLLAPCLDHAVRGKLTTYEQTADRLEFHARQGKAGVAKLRAILEPRLGGALVSESALETRLLKVLDDAGLPAPDTQHRPSWLRHINGRVDMAYVAERVALEGDSQRFHGAPEAFQVDRTRDNLAQIAGWVLLRFTWEDITKRPAYVAATVEKALAIRRRDSQAPAR